MPFDQSFVLVENFSKKHDACVWGNNLEEIDDQTPDSCAQKCIDYGTGVECKGFEFIYGVHPDGAPTNRCILQSSADTTGCPGQTYAMDFYERVV